jgi:hypothetical protein
MNIISCEAFIDWCDKLFISNESSVNLTPDQEQYTCGELNETYKDIIISAYKKSISKFKDLQNVSYNREEYGYFQYNKYSKYPEEFYMIIDGFGNYPYEMREHDVEKGIKLLNKFKVDLINLQKAFQANLPKNAKLNVAIEDEEGQSINRFIEYMSKYIKEDGYAPSNDVKLRVYISQKDVKIISDAEVKNAKEQKYLKIYEEFIKFLKNPHVLSGSLWSGQIADICRIKDISSKKLNEIVAKNIKRVGSPKDINPNSFDQSDYGKDVSKSLGKCYTLENLDGFQLVYSINKKSLYWLDYQHCEYDIFYHNYEYSSREFEDAAFGYDDRFKKRLLELFESYDNQNGIVFIK